MSPNAELRARVLAAAAAAPSATRSQARRRAAAILAIGVAVALVVFDFGRGFAHGAGRPVGITVAIVVGWALASTALTVIALGRGGSTLARRPDVLGAVALAAPFVLFVWMQIWSGSYVEPFERLGVRCFLLTAVLSIAPIAAFVVLRRGAEPRMPAALGAAAGAASGAWAGVLVDLWCPLVNPSHTLVGHALPLAVVIALSALVGSRLLGVRPRATRSSS